MAKRRRRTDQERVYAEMYSDYRKNARNRGLVFDVPREVAYTLFTKSCEYCGRHDTRCVQDKRLNFKACVRASGIDRVNNSLGYIEGNVVPCCSICNLSKRTSTPETWFAWLSDLACFQIRKHMGGGNLTHGN